MTDRAMGSGTSRAARWGWGLLLVVAGLLLLNGVAWYFVGGSLGTFEQDMGVPVETVRAAYPTVVRGIAWEARTTSLVYAGFGLFALLVALEGLRRGSAWARTSWWAVTACLVALTANVLASGQSAFGVFLAGMAVVAVAGQLLVRR